jgi:hypothetical protein
MQTINEITMQQTPESLFKFEMPIDSMEPKQLLRYALHQARGWRSMAKSLSNTYNLYEGPDGEILSHPTAHQICDWIDEHLASFDEDMIRVATPELVLVAAARHYDDADLDQEPIRSVLVKHITTYLYAKKYEATLLNKAELVQEPKPKKKASPKTKKAAVEVTEEPKPEEVTEEPKPEEETKEEQPQEPKSEEETKEDQPKAPKPKRKASPKTKKTAVEETKEEQPEEPKSEEETKEEQPKAPKPKKRAAPKTKKAAVEVTEEQKPEEETKEEQPQEPKPEEETKEEQPKKKASPKAKKAEAEVTEEEPKKKRSPSAYNVFISNELSRLRQEDPKLNHKVAMAMAVAAWKTNKAADESAEKKETTEEVEQSTQEEAAQPEVTLEKVLSA